MLQKHSASAAVVGRGRGKGTTAKVGPTKLTRTVTEPIVPGIQDSAIALENTRLHAEMEVLKTQLQTEKDAHEKAQNTIHVNAAILGEATHHRSSLKNTIADLEKRLEKATKASSAVPNAFQRFAELRAANDDLQSLNGRLSL
jgi:chromosome segregation ATPase